MHLLPRNSHLNIGAGRVVWQDIVRIDQAIKKRDFHKNERIIDACNRAKEGNGRLHLLGLVCIFTHPEPPIIDSPYLFTRFPMAAYTRTSPISSLSSKRQRNKAFQIPTFTSSEMGVIPPPSQLRDMRNNCSTSSRRSNTVSSQR